MACVVRTNHKPGNLRSLVVGNRPSPSSDIDGSMDYGVRLRSTPPLESTIHAGSSRRALTFQVWPSLPREGLLPGLLAGEPVRLRHTGKVCASRGMLRVLCSDDGRRGFIPCLTSSKTTARLCRAPIRVFYSKRQCAIPRAGVCFFYPTPNSCSVSVPWWFHLFPPIRRRKNHQGTEAQRTASVL